VVEVDKLDNRFVVVVAGSLGAEEVDMTVEPVVVVVDILGLRVVEVVVDLDNPFVAVAAVVIMLQRMHLVVSFHTLSNVLDVP
jgi:hypothetical protein